MEVDIRLCGVIVGLLIMGFMWGMIISHVKEQFPIEKPEEPEEEDEDNEELEEFQ